MIAEQVCDSVKFRKSYKIWFNSSLWLFFFSSARHTVHIAYHTPNNISHSEHQPIILHNLNSIHLNTYTQTFIYALSPRSRGDSISCALASVFINDICMHILIRWQITWSDIRDFRFGTANGSACQTD